MVTRILSELRYRLRALFRRQSMDAELQEELQGHLERERDKLIREGPPPVEAERLARARFGAVSGTVSAVREARGISALEHLAHDLRLAWRTLRFRKTFSLGVVLTLALGLGVNAT